MGTSTFKNIKTALIAVAAFFSCAATNVNAQTTVTTNNVMVSSGYVCGSTAVALIDEYNPAATITAMPGSSLPSTFKNSKDRPQSIQIFSVDTDGTETLLDEINVDNPQKDGNGKSTGISPNSLISIEGQGKPWVSYQFLRSAQIYGGTGTGGVNNTSSLHYLRVYPQNIASDSKPGNPDILGTTLLIRLNMSQSVAVGSTLKRIVNFYFDPIGSNQVDLEGDNTAFRDENDMLLLLPCPGSGPVTMNIYNDLTPYKDENDNPRTSFLGNTYTASYVWQRAADTWTDPLTRPLGEVATNTNTYTDNDIANFTTSGSTTYQPSMTLSANGTPTNCIISFYEGYVVTLYTPLQLKNTFENITSGATDSGDIDKFYACSGDDVVYTPTFIQELEDGDYTCSDGEAYWTLERLNPDGSVAEIIKAEGEYYSGEYVELTNLTETSTYRVTCEYLDPNGSSLGSIRLYGDFCSETVCPHAGFDNPCPTVKTFTIEVRQTDANSTITTPDHACAEDDVPISASVSNIQDGSTGADYAYRWFASDDEGQNYYDLNTSDYLTSADPDWSDPTTTVSTTFSNINYPFKDGTDDGNDYGPRPKYIKFQLANTYKINGTTYFCPIPEVTNFDVYKLPILDPVDDVYACANQKVAFQVKLADGVYQPDESTNKGMTYEVFSDAACTTPASNIINLIGGASTSDNRSEGDANTNTNRLNSTDNPGAYAWFGIESLDKDYTLYVRVQNEESGCYSKPIKVEIKTLPVPEVDNLTLSTTTYCKLADASALTAEATLKSEFDDYYNTNTSLTKPSLTYHWAWSNAQSNALGTAETVDNNILTGAEAANFDGLTQYVGNAPISVWVSSSDNCGYNLDYNGKPLSSTSNALTPVETTAQINELPLFNIANDVTACADQGDVSVNLASADDRDLTFTFTPIGSAPAPHSTSVDVAGNGNADFSTTVNPDAITDITTYQYDVLVVDHTSLACQNTDTLAFTVYPVPSLSISPADGLRYVCKESTMTLSVTPSITENGAEGPATNYQYQWSVDGTDAATTQSFNWTPNASASTGNHDIAVTVTYTFADGHTCSTTESIKVYVNERPEVIFTSDQTICEGVTATLTATVDNHAAVNYDNLPSYFVSSISSSSVEDDNLNVTPDGTGYGWSYSVAPVRDAQYTLFVMNKTTGCESKEANVKVSVNRKARVALTSLSENEVCAGDHSFDINYSLNESTLDLNSINVEGFTVSNTTTSAITVEATLPAGSIIFQQADASATQGGMTAKTSEGCDVIFENTLTYKVNAIPDAPDVKTPADNEVCLGVSKTFTFDINNKQSGFKYEYYWGDSEPDASASPVATTTFPNAQYSFDGKVLTESIKVWVRAIDTNHPTNCTSPFAGPYDIIVNKVETPTVAALSPICQGTSATIEVTSPTPTTGYTYTYKFSGNGTGILQSNHSNTFTTPALDENTSYYVEVVHDEKGCVSDRVQVDVDVHLNPIGQAAVNYYALDGSNKVTLPDGSSVIRAAFCQGDNGFATVSLRATKLHDNTSSFTSTLVAVSEGNVSDWTKISENAYTLTKSTTTWDNNVTLTFTINDGYCTSEEFTATVETVPTLSKPTLSLSFNEFCENIDDDLTISILPYADLTSDVNIAFYVRKAGESSEYMKFFTSDGSITKKTLTDLAIDSNVEFYAKAYNVKTGCESQMSDVLTLTRHTLPIPTLTATPTVLCPDATATLSVAEPFTKYEWLDYDSKTATPDQSSVDVTLPETRTYRVQVTDNNGCVSEPVSTTITVHPRPAFTVVVSPDVVCQGTDERVEFTITPTNSDKVDFELPYTFSTLAPSSKSIQTDVDAAGNTTYFVDGQEWTEASVTFQFQVYSTAAYNSCLSEDVQTTVTVVPALAKPEIYAPAPQDGSLTRDIHICEGSTSPLTISIDNTSAYPTADGSTYSYHWYSDATGTTELLNGADYTITADGSISFVPTANMTIYAKTVRENAPNCESEMSEVLTITIESLPATPVAIAPVIYICQPEEAANNLSLSVQSAATEFTYHWFIQSEGEIDSDMSDDSEVATVTGSSPASITNPDKTSYYYVIAESIYGCFSSGKSNVVTATVGTNPEITALDTPADNICSGDNFSFSVGVTGDPTNVNYYYEITSSNAAEAMTTGTIDASGNFSNTFAPANTTTYTIQVWALFDDHCKSQNSVTHTVTVRGLPTVNGVYAKPDVCAEAPFSLTLYGVTSHDLASCANPANAQLEVALLDKDANVLATTNVTSGSDADVSYPDGITRDLLPLSYQVRDISTGWTTSCPLTVTLSVAVVDIPTFNLINTNGKVDQTPSADPSFDYCADETLNLEIETALPTVDPDGRTITYSYQWRHDGVEILGETTSQLQISKLSTSDSGKYELVVKTKNGDCEYIGTANVTVHALPTPTIIPNALNIYCTDGDLSLSTNDDYVSYHWVINANTPVDVYTTSPDVDLTYPIANLDLAPAASYVEVNLYATDKYGCESVYPTIHNVILSNPPAITSVEGRETCNDNPFSLKITSTSTNFTVKLFDRANAEQTITAVTSGSDILYETDVPQGTYNLVLTDVNTGCSVSDSVTLERYDIDFYFVPTPDRFYCSGEGVNVYVYLYDNNDPNPKKPRDFFSKIENVKLTSKVVMGTNASFETVIPDFTFSADSGLLSFDPSATSPQIEPSSNPYTLRSTLSFNFKGATTSLSCPSDTVVQNFYVLPLPELVSDPAMPVCLRTDVQFTVKQDNINPSWTQQYLFFVNGAQVINADGDYTSNVFNTADHPEISLNEGDVVTAEAIMDNGGHTCVSEPITISFKGDFKPEITNVDLTAENCKGADINFTVESVLPTGVATPFTLVNFKSYQVFVVDNGVESLAAEYSGLDNLTHDGSFIYNGDSPSISFYVVATDVNDCVVNSDPVTVKIKQFKIVDVVVTNDASEVMNTNDLCADINYTYTAVLQDAEGNTITPGADYDFTFSMDGVEWTDPTPTAINPDNVTNSHAVTTAPISLVVNATHISTGCQTDATLALYLPYNEEFTFHAKPAPNETLKDSFLPVSTDPADARKYEICYDDDFGFDVSGSIVTVVFDGVKVATYVNGALDVTIDESTLSTSQITSSYDAGTSVFLFDINPSDTFHSLSFLVSDGTCEVLSDEWQFRKYQDIDVKAIDETGADILANGIATICEGQTLSIEPSTSETAYTQGYVFTLDGADVSATDFSEFTYLFQNAAKGDYELIIRPNFGTNACSKSITIKVEEAPVPDVTLTDEADAAVTPTATATNSWSFSFCEQAQHTLTLSGASNFQILSVDRDGVDVTADFDLTTATPGTRSIAWPINLNYVANTNSDDFSTYTFNLLYSVGTCEQNVTVTAQAYKLPDATFINGTPLPLVISGAEVPVEVTAGYARYEFFINGTLVQDDASNILPGNLNIVTSDTVNISVTIHNTFGCTQTIEAQTVVLEGILPKTITTSADFYCTDDAGVKISVLDPQIGVTYFVDGIASLAPITVTDPTQEVAWEPVRLTDPTVANPETFTVKAYYDALPTQIFDMTNTVDVEEVKSPASTTTAADLTVDDCSVAQSTSFSWTVENTETDMFYVLVNETEANTEISSVYPGTGADLVLPIYDIMTNAYGAAKNGVYRVIARSKRLNGDYACEKTIDGALTINLPTTNAYAVTVTPASANVCIDALDFKIILENSDYDATFTREYILYRDGVMVDRRFSNDHSGQIEFVDTDLASLTAGKYTYSVVCSFNGCLQPMANTVTVTFYDKPATFNVTASNDGYYCHDDANGVTVTVDGSQDGLIYKLINVDTNAEVAQELGHADGSAIDFLNVTKGHYYVAVSIPDTEGCTTILNDVTVTQLDEPATINATISAAGSTGAGSKDLTICVEQEYQITVSGADFNASPDVIRNYELYTSDGTLISTDMTGCGAPDETNGTFCFPLTKALTPGTYSFDILAKSTVALTSGTYLECSKLIAGVVTMTVKEHSLTGETLTLDLNPHPEIDCYGSDITVENPNLSTVDSVEYRLFKLDAHGSYNALSPLQTIKPYNGDDPVFKNIKDALGDYIVRAYNGACDELVGDVHIENPRFAQMQELEFDSFVCEGDGGVKVNMKDSEKDVTYTLYFISPELYKTLNPDNAIISTTTLSENLYGQMMGTVTATYDHERLTFSQLDYGDGDLTDVITREGYYYVTSIKVGAVNPCPTASPLLQYEILNLPLSFNIEKSNIYCDVDGSNDIYIENAEYDPEATITYSLWKLDEFGNSSYFDDVVSNSATDKPLYFSKKATEGIYYAIAAKQYSDKFGGKICTSRMRSDLILVYAPDLSSLAFADDTISFCFNDPVAYHFDDTNAKQLLADAQATKPTLTGIKLYLTQKGETPENEESVISEQLLTASSDIYFDELESSNYTIWASWAASKPEDDLACLTELGNFVVKKSHTMPVNVIDDVACGDSYTIDPSLWSLGTSYSVVDTVRDIVWATVTYDAQAVAEGKTPTFEYLRTGGYRITAYDIESGCQVTMGKLDVRGLPSGYSSSDIYACAGEPVSYDVSYDLRDSAYYYLAAPGENPKDNALQVIRYYQGEPNPHFTNLQDGENEIWISFDNNECLTQIENIHVYRYPEIPSNVINESICGDSYTVDNSYYFEIGQIFTLVDHATGVVAAVDTVHFILVGEIQFDHLATGTYDLLSGFEDGYRCQTQLGTIKVNAPFKSTNLHALTFCPDATVSYDFPTEILLDGATYYVTTPDNDPLTGASLSIKYDGSGSITVNNLQEGQNLIFASFDNYECLSLVDTVDVTLHPALPTKVIDESICGNTYTLDSLYYIEGMTYSLVDVATNTEITNVFLSNAKTSKVMFSDIPSGDYFIFAGFDGGTSCRSQLGSLKVNAPFKSTNLHALNFCPDDVISYDFPTEILLNGATYYVTTSGSDPRTGASISIKYDGSGNITLNNLQEGQNLIWASFDSFECISLVDTVDVTLYPELPTNAVNAAICGLEYSVDDSYLVNGATYELYNKADGSKVASEVYTTASTTLTLSVLEPGDYELRVSIGDTPCVTTLGTVTFRGEIDTTNPIDATVVVCGASSASFTLTSDIYLAQLVEGLTYYVLEPGQTPSGILTTGRKYVAGQDITFRGLVAGDYKIWASFDGYGCEVEVGDLHLTDADIEDVELIASLSCDNEVTMSTDTSYVGVTYQIVGIAKDKSTVYTSDAIEGNGQSLTWPAFTYDSNVNRYEVHASAGPCPEAVVASIYNGSIQQDFDLVVANFYSTGGGCTGDPIALVLDESVEGLTYYLTADGDDNRTPLAGSEKQGDGNALTWTGVTLPIQSGTVVYHLYAYKGNLATTSCFSDDAWRTVTINFDATTFPVGHLVAVNDVLDYCQGEIGIRLGYINQPRPGETYRLYKKTDDDWGRELVDIQEIPSYLPDDTYSATDTLFFNGWGYNESSKDYATSGYYFVDVESEQGCNQVTDTILVIENPLPVQSVDSVYFMLYDKDGYADTTTINTEYGVMGGRLVYHTGRPGFTYYLLMDGEVIPGAEKTPTSNGDVVFGPIYDFLTDTVRVNDSIKFVYRQEVLDDGIYWGEGVYSVLVKDNETECTSELGNVTFVAEELTAYNVYIYLNKDEMARTINLVPAYEADTDIAHKGNHMYIDWSSRCDKVYCPAITTGDDGYYINDEQVTQAYNLEDNTNYFAKGYSNIRGSYDSKYQKFTGKAGSANVWFNVVQNPDKKVSGTYGFINVDHTTNDSSAVEMSTQTGYFFYMKQPSFYGQEEIEYYVENRQLAERKSNIAKIQILCGNEDTGDNESVFLIPNAFSPNGDGLNDYFKIIIPDRYQDNSESKLQVFNRWGTLVYRSSGLRYGENEDWWDGNSSTSNMVTLGQNLPSGTYYYVFTITFIDKQHATRSERKMHGYVELRR